MPKITAEEFEKALRKGKGNFRPAARALGHSNYQNFVRVLRRELPADARNDVTRRVRAEFLRNALLQARFDGKETARLLGLKTEQEARDYARPLGGFKLFKRALQRDVFKKALSETPLSEKAPLTRALEQVGWRGERANLGYSQLGFSLARVKELLDEAKMRRIAEAAQPTRSIVGAALSLQKSPATLHGMMQRRGLNMAKLLEKYGSGKTAPPAIEARLREHAEAILRAGGDARAAARALGESERAVYSTHNWHGFSVSSLLLRYTNVGETLPMLVAKTRGDVGEMSRDLAPRNRLRKHVLHDLLKFNPPLEHRAWLEALDATGYDHERARWRLAWTKPYYQAVKERFARSVKFTPGNRQWPEKEALVSAADGTKYNLVERDREFHAQLEKNWRRKDEKKFLSAILYEAHAREKLGLPFPEHFRDALWPITLPLPRPPFPRTKPYLEKRRAAEREKKRAK